MTIRTTVDAQPKLVEMSAERDFTAQDYGKIVPEPERLIGQYGKLELLFDMRGVNQVKPAAVWRDLEFDASHLNDFGWQEALAKLGNPFTAAHVEFFGDRAKALDWVTQG